MKKVPVFAENPYFRVCIGRHERDSSFKGRYATYVYQEYGVPNYRACKNITKNDT